MDMVLFAATARKAWEMLSNVFVSMSIARSYGIRQQMSNLKKCDMSIGVLSPDENLQCLPNKYRHASLQ
jgi:hypothetical protein